MIKEQSVHLLSKVYTQCIEKHFPIYFGDRRGHIRMIVGFTTTCAISAYHH